MVGVALEGARVSAGRRRLVYVSGWGWAISVSDGVRVEGGGEFRLARYDGGIGWWCIERARVDGSLVAGLKCGGDVIRGGRVLQRLFEMWRRGK